MLIRNDIIGSSNKTSLVKPAHGNTKITKENEILIDALNVISSFPSESIEAYLQSKSSETSSQELENGSLVRSNSTKVRNNWAKLRMLALNQVQEKNSRLSAKHVYASDQENYIYLSILISIVVVLSVFACLTVYLLFPRFR